jgi:hypothetical protein
MRVRPRSIIWFERAVYLWLGLGVINSYIVYYRMRAAPPDPTHAGPGVIFGFLFISLVIYGLLVWLIAYRANNVGRWVFVVFTGIGLLGLLQIREIIAYGGPSAAIALIEHALSVVLILLLFRRDSMDWFAGCRQIDPEIFR